jgi:hypothetical protein
MEIFFVLVPGRLPWRNNWSQHYKRVVLFLVHVLVLVSSGSHVIALRGRYSDGCTWKHIRWSLV